MITITHTLTPEILVSAKGVMSNRPGGNIFGDYFGETRTNGKAKQSKWYATQNA